MVCARELSIPDVQTRGAGILAGDEPQLHSEILSPKQSNNNNNKQ